MELINDTKEYTEHFSKSIIEYEVNKGKLNEALKQALEIRKFEIELYWKRATYFWAFIAAAFAAYFAILSSASLESHKSITILISIIGTLFSLGWYFVNRGSKFWQKNWEMHVARLENGIIGPLYKTVWNPRRASFLDITDEYPFSVSKINQILSFVVFLIWLYILMYSYYYTINCSCPDKFDNFYAPILLSIILIIGITLIIRKSESGLSVDIKNDLRIMEQNEGKLEKEPEFISRLK